jgi:hypothetical protein
MKGNRNATIQKKILIVLPYYIFHVDFSVKPKVNCASAPQEVIELDILPIHIPFADTYTWLNVHLFATQMAISLYRSGRNS